jgi:hypothetical protein
VIDLRLTKTLAAALAAATFMGAAINAAPAMAQPRAYGSPDYGQSYGPGYGQQNRYYYNGQWVDQNNWEQNRQREFQRNRRYRDNNNNDATAAAIIGFALGAAILGTQNDARMSYGYSQDRNHGRLCSRKYRGYDFRSNTYLGRDGYRHYCMG